MAFVGAIHSVIVANTATTQLFAFDDWSDS